MGKKKDNSGIYQIRNAINNHVYVGQTTKLSKRWVQHYSLLKNNKHKNVHLQRAWNKYGEENFLYEVILYCEPFELTKYEQFFEDFYRSKGISYNIRKCVDSNKGISWREDSKKRLSEFRTGKKQTEETKEKLREISKRENLSSETLRKRSESLSGENHPMYGKHPSEEAKQKMRENHWDNSGENHPFYGKRHTEESKRMMSEHQPRRFGEDNPNYGKSLSEETRKKLSEASKGRIVSEETRFKISEASKGEKNPYYGKKHTPEDRIKMSEAKGITPEIIFQIKKYLTEGISVIKICEHIGVCQFTVYKVKNGGYEYLNGEGKDESDI